MRNATTILAIVAVMLGLGAVGLAIASGEDTQTCPDGQHVVSVHVTTGDGELDVNQGHASLPAGYSYQAGGGGTKVTSNSNSATIHGKALSFDVVCR